LQAPARLSRQTQTRRGGKAQADPAAPEGAAAGRACCACRSARRRPGFVTADRAGYAGCSVSCSSSSTRLAIFGAWVAVSLVEGVLLMRFRNLITRVMVMMPLLQDHAPVQELAKTGQGVSFMPPKWNCVGDRPNAPFV